MRLVGVDGCPAGWVVAESQLAGGGRGAGMAPFPAPGFRIVSAFGELLASLAGERAVVCVDIPIGLASGEPRDDGRRRADHAARAFLGGHRGSSVFSAPCRPTLETTTHEAACAAELEARGKKLSKQAFGILPKIREVDSSVIVAHHLPPDQSDGVIVREVHPEVAFALLRGGGEAGWGLNSSKRTHEGEAERLGLLRPFFPELDVTAIRTDVRQRHQAQCPERPFSRIVGRDDIVDALVCLVVAGRIARDEARTFPEDMTEKDERGLRMEIVG